MKKIILSKPIINIKTTTKIFKDVLKSTFVNEGKQTTKFEKKICNFLNVKYAVSTTSGTTALFLALKACGIKNNDEVIVPNITFPATANAIKMAGGKPVFVDVNPKDILIDEKSLLKKITKKTKFIIPVHVSGRGRNIKKLLKICKNRSIKIIEDAAEAFGSKVNKKNLGTFGQAGCFSFAPNKIITTGQGGVVVTNNLKIYKILHIIKNQGRLGPTSGGEDNYVSLGTNLKFTNLQASLGLSQINELKWRINKLIKIHQFYRKNIIENKNFKIINFKISKGELPLWTDVWCNNRNQLFKFLEKNNVICRYYWKPLNTNKPYLSSFKNLDNSKKLQKKLMWLPSSLDITVKEQKKVCNLINSFYLNVS
ncbi:DegT/DnrJ/EryC1/StrS family aminotransferase [Candidatus Pelagibacter sp.]|nr:DegT/DnrJ/EryC1/StrS family aminotransferase [Candidatus Pelagibacter sp.]